MAHEIKTQHSFSTSGTPHSFFPDAMIANNSPIAYDFTKLASFSGTEPEKAVLLYDSRAENFESRLTGLENLIGELLAKIDLNTEAEIVIRDLSFTEAKKEIRQYFKQHHGEDINAADLEENLGIDFELATKACESLEKEGKIKGV